MNLVTPARTHLDSYTAALRTGWSPNKLLAATHLGVIEANGAVLLENFIPSPQYCISGEMQSYLIPL